MNRLRVPFAIKSLDAAAMTFSGYASIFHVPDDGQDIMLPGAFTKTLAERGPQGANRIKILALHRGDWLPIGKPTRLWEDQHGLGFDGQISKTTLGLDVMTLLRDGVLTEMSIGYDTIKEEFDKALGLRKLIEVRLWEISPVTWAMHPMALIDNVKSLVDQFDAEDGRRVSPAVRASAKQLLALLSEPDASASTPPSDAAALPVLDPALVQSLRACNESMRSHFARRS
jgi:HK97 family phage prohead protease